MANNVKHVDVPELEHDRMMEEKYHHKVGANGKLERRIVAALCRDLAEKGWVPDMLDDGDTKVHIEVAPIDATKAMMEELFNRDETWVRFGHKTETACWVRFILGSGVDIISDYYGYHTESSFYAVMRAFEPKEYE